MDRRARRRGLAMTTGVVRLVRVLANPYGTAAPPPPPSTVMRGLIPRIHVFDAVPRQGKTWMAGTEPGHDEARGAERLPDAEVVAHGQQKQE